VVCCAGPALIAGGVLSTLGAVVGSPLFIAAGALLVGGAVVLTLRRRDPR